MAKLGPILEHTKILEGGWAVDQGGKTMFGITENTLKEFQRITGKLLGVKIENLTWEQAIQIYTALFWQPIKGTLIKSQNAASVIFDYAVNSGPGKATKDLQRVLNEDLGVLVDDKEVAIDGDFGPQTLKAVNIAGESLVKPLMKRRKSFMVYLAQWKPSIYADDLNGWLKRLSRLQSFLNPVSSSIEVAKKATKKPGVAASLGVLSLLAITAVIAKKKSNK